VFVLIAWLGWECMKYSRMIGSEWKQALLDIRIKAVKPSIVEAARTPGPEITSVPVSKVTKGDQSINPPAVNNQEIVVEAQPT
jgi:hypothetical protein